MYARRIDDHGAVQVVAKSDTVHVRAGVGREGVHPDVDVEWQVLTVSGLRLAYGGGLTAEHWRAVTLPIEAVSFQGRQWRDYSRFRQFIEIGIDPAAAFELISQCA